MAEKPTTVNTSSFTATNNSEEKQSYPSLSHYSKHQFQLPSKRIGTPQHIPTFLESIAYKKINQFILDLGNSVKSLKLTDNVHISPTCRNLLDFLQKLDTMVDDTPPFSQEQSQTRYGNKAYRVWHTKLQKTMSTLLSGIFPDDWSSNTDASLGVTINGIHNEISAYVMGSFGDKTRIDYGTGHELCFMCVLLILFELKLLTPEDFPALVLRVYYRYLVLMRKIQSTYLLEPAGSRGVWGLDDYQFLAFYFGAAQLIDHPNIKPSDILNKWALQESDKYIYLSCIQFILQMKSGIFAEHSPLLNDITSVVEWKKVQTGLYKMYQDDVIKKFPVIQHFLFGSILSIDLQPVKDNKAKDDLQQRKQAMIDRLNSKRGIQPNARPVHSASQTPPIVTAAPWAMSNAVKPGGAEDETGIPVGMVMTGVPWVPSAHARTLDENKGSLAGGKVKQKKSRTALLKEQMAAAAQKKE